MPKKITLAALAVAAVLAGCGNNNEPLSQEEAELREHIASGMPQTVREMHRDDQDVIALPYSYSVPTIRGMFQEMYYWDTYFTNEGLLILGDLGQARKNVDASV